MAYTRAQVREKVRQRCDLENTTPQTDAEINDHINDAAAYLHDFLIGTYGSRYSVSLASLATVAGTSVYTLALSPTLLKPVALKLVIDDLQYPLSSFEWQEAIISNVSRAWGPGDLPQYAFSLGHAGTVALVFDPPPDAVHSVRLVYHPVPPTYTNDVDVVGIPHADLLIIEACIRVKNKEERDASFFIQERAAIQKRIEDWVAPFDTANPARTQRAASPYARTTWRRERVF